MLKIEQSPEHMVVIHLVGSVEQGDIETMSKAIKEKLTTNTRLGLLVDISEWNDITGEAIAEDLKFEFSLLGKFGRFPRLALVSDKQYAMAVASFFDPLIPTMEIRSFCPDEYDKALEFAADIGVVKSVAKPSVTLIETETPGILAYEINGRLAKQDVEQVVAPLKRAIEEHDRIDLFARLTNYPSFDLSILAEQSVLSATFSAAGHVRRYAVVGAQDWVKHAAEMVTSMLPMDLRFFEAEREDEAWTWLQS